MQNHINSEQSFIHPYVKVSKRLLDIFISLIGLSILLAITPFVALAIKINSKGPVLYHQLRVGKSWNDHTELFILYKFRTMHLNNEQSKWASNNDPRITRVGNILRKYRIDEFPQFINVIRGEMSLIGPRPEQPGLINSLDTQIPFYNERVRGVAPGITGLAQVSQGYDKSIEDVRTKVAYDHAYGIVLVNPLQWLKTDIKIIFLTILSIFTKQGH